ncbi:ATP/GTP-binding protein [Gordonia pseudamarae]|uniref:ATP/GTP-binding protein n=1 Tax=Gordonia pseudamarae TaxID=2831662 RepID=A0ABX6ICL0_9ACTN|nr:MULTISPECIES: cysteine protease StiP family protein [Gordonia]MBD0022864.1 cysteine protease StiP family protein [Gordonia sp. (in: high G+C Gram-positive bacteria)]QHN24730.1 ATP/GTP-binding protein [Gordonia pseudamarae]QHN33661.1 ATP/GTP-binding protein [Gordonia pseudamarae]
MSTPTTPPLSGPEFGSYGPDEVTWLLKDLSHVALEGAIADREKAIQSGRAHYAESLPVEFQPDAEYQKLFRTTLSESADRLAVAIGAVTDLLIADRGTDLTLVSLARAGTPVGILMRRWAGRIHGLDLPHYTISIVRDRGIDSVALDYITGRHRPESVVFVDGWTGKGAIARELSAALAGYAAAGGPALSDDLAVLADPGYCVRTFGTRDDFLIASACLNSTVSGLVSRTVLNSDHIGPGEFHGAKFYRELAPYDMSNLLLDTVTDRFSAVREAAAHQCAQVLATDREPTWAGWRSIEQVQHRYGLGSINFVKPGVGETTRVLLRRVPRKILVDAPDRPEHEHIRLLAAQREVPVEVVDRLAYSCVGLIKESTE